MHRLKGASLCRDGHSILRPFFNAPLSIHTRLASLTANQNTNLLTAEAVYRGKVRGEGALRLRIAL